MPFYATLSAALITLAIFVDFSVVAMVFSIALILWLIGLPASFCIAWIVSHFKWNKNDKGPALTALLGFAITLIYELIVMWITDLISHQVGSFWHPEVLELAGITAVVSYFLATLWLPKEKI